MEIVDTIYNDNWGRLDSWVLSRMNGKPLLAEADANAELTLDNLGFATEPSSLSFVFYCSKLNSFEHQNKI